MERFVDLLAAVGTKGPPSLPWSIVGQSWSLGRRAGFVHPFRRWCCGGNLMECHPPSPVLDTTVDTTKTPSDPQGVGMRSGEGPIGAAKGKQTNPPPSPQPALVQAPVPRLPLFFGPFCLQSSGGDLGFHFGQMGALRQRPDSQTEGIGSQLEANGVLPEAHPAPRGHPEEPAVRPHLDPTQTHHITVHAGVWYAYRCPASGTGPAPLSEQGHGQALAPRVRGGHDTPCAPRWKAEVVRAGPPSGLRSENTGGGRAGGGSLLHQFLGGGGGACSATATTTATPFVSSSVPDWVCGLRGGGGCSRTQTQIMSQYQTVFHTTMLSKCAAFAFADVPPPPCDSHALVQATVGVGTVLLWDPILIRYQM